MSDDHKTERTNKLNKALLQSAKKSIQIAYKPNSTAEDKKPNLTSALTIPHRHCLQTAKFGNEYENICNTDTKIKNIIPNPKTKVEVENSKSLGHAHHHEVRKFETQSPLAEYVRNISYDRENMLANNKHRMK